MTGALSGLRADLALIAQWVPRGAKVLDLGCGDGALLEWLSQNKGCRGYGAEIDEGKVLSCVARGVHVIQADIDSGLSIFAHANFDLVILSQALQATHQTERVLGDIARLGREVIVSIPNFGHWSHIQSLLTGHMPVNDRLPYEWYDTPNRHLATTKDFEALLHQMGMRVMERLYVREDTGGEVHRVTWATTLRATLALYRFSGMSSEHI
ncbi:MAG: methionine biosynthesis protein MetW [Betaproteobacteria bacterium]|nr:methionine biosynthesis protein MetW [Betaproteobacteria bacterium]NBT75025.1 methionine biosynthesis protein MetW [Betaproteobacteria bacterium]NBY14312.1 methionine biosynthesis protein MetW [Betaproteobacteria bacterium]NCA16020.1 methionine biosynthesis protein MetW [Betaproteobacteria bacterium]NDF03959.1 methionine biosynthesis protein MetW [Betaproteobacteria bacterium]